MTKRQTGRSCKSCSALLASHNHDAVCAACMSKQLQESTSASVHSPEFWEDKDIRAALQIQHFGMFLRAYRQAHDPVVKQAQLGQWINLTQGQISRLEHAKAPVRDLERLARWAEALHVPSSLLWFRRPNSSDAWEMDPSGLKMEPLPGTERDPVRRRKLFKATGLAATAAIGSSLTGGLPALTERECAERLAWELWQRGLTAIHVSDLPVSVANYLGVDITGKANRTCAARISPEGLIVGNIDNYFSFVQSSLIDVFVGQHLFRSIVKGQSGPFAIAQTSHATDLVLQQLVERHGSSVSLLGQWMRGGATPVLQVNSAGVLAKIGDVRITNATIAKLKRSDETRQLYLTAVMSRVLEVDWNRASNMAAGVEHGKLVQPLTDHQVASLARELQNPRDGAARWCSVVTLGLTGNGETSHARASLHYALQEEPCAENLRAIGNVLMGNNPLTV